MKKIVVSALMAVLVMITAGCSQTPTTGYDRISDVSTAVRSMPNGTFAVEFEYREALFFTSEEVRKGVNIPFKLHNDSQHGIMTLKICAEDYHAIYQVLQADWITISPKEVALESGEKKTVWVTLKVPEDVNLPRMWAIRLILSNKQSTYEYDKLLIVSGIDSWSGGKEGQKTKFIVKAD